LQDAFHICKDESEAFVIGGAQIFEQSLPLANNLYLTIIHHQFDADTFLPEIDQAHWIEAESSTHEPDEKNLYSYTFIKYIRA
jgi:dihydrofolate reductase